MLLQVKLVFKRLIVNHEFSHPNPKQMVPVFPFINTMELDTKTYEQHRKKRLSL
jgi:hypothetical protein